MYKDGPRQTNQFEGSEHWNVPTWDYYSDWIPVTFSQALSKVSQVIKSLLKEGAPWNMLFIPLADFVFLVDTSTLKDLTALFLSTGTWQVAILVVLSISGKYSTSLHLSMETCPAWTPNLPQEWVPRSASFNKRKRNVCDRFCFPIGQVSTERCCAAKHPSWN